MAFDDLKDIPDIETNFFVTFEMRISVTNFSIYSGSVYVADFPAQKVVRFIWGGSDPDSFGGSGEFEPYESLAGLPDGGYFFDRKNQKLYFRLSVGTDGHYLVATIKCFVGTKGSYLPERPADDPAGKELFYYYPLVLQAPEKKMSLSDSIYGYLPVQQGVLKLSLPEFVESRFLYDCSTMNVRVEVFKCLDKIIPENFKRVFLGLGSSFTIDEDAFTFNVNDFNSVFQETVRFDEPPLPSTDSAPTIGRRCIGRVPGVRMEQSSTSVTTFIARTGRSPRYSDRSAVKLMCQGSSATSSKFYIPAGDSLDNYNVTDRLVLSSARTAITGGYNPSGTIKYAEITGKGSDGGGNYITHEDTTSAASTTPFVWTSFIARRVDVYMSSTIYKAYPFRDYTESLAQHGSIIDSVGIINIVFTLNYATNMALPRFLQAGDLVKGTIYGDTDPNPVGTLQAMLLEMEFTEDDIDLDSFSAIYDDYANDQIAMIIPDTVGGQPPTYQELIARILQSALLRLYQNNDGKWTLGKLKPIEDDEDKSDLSSDADYFNSSRSFTADYSDLCTSVKVNYAAREVNDSVTAPESDFQTVYVRSQYAVDLHDANVIKEVDSVFQNQASALKLARRLLYIFSSRSGKHSLQVPLKNVELDMDSRVLVGKIQSEFAQGDENIFASITEIERDSEKISLVADDQLGIQKNKDDWDS